MNPDRRSSRLRGLARLVSIWLAMTVAGAAAEQPEGSFDDFLFASRPAEAFRGPEWDLQTSLPRFAGERDILGRLDQLEQQVWRLSVENRRLRENAGGHLAGRPGVEDARHVAPDAESAARRPVPVAEAVAIYEIGEQTDFSASWQDALQFQTADGAFRVGVGGRLHNDFGWWQAGQRFQFAAGGVGPLHAGANFRRARLRVTGTVYDTVTWVTEYGFENGVPTFFDTFGELTDLPVLGAVRIGHFREPFSLDALTGGNDLPFMERSLIQEAFVPFRNTGIMVHRSLAGDSMTFAAGGFRGNSNRFGADADDGSYAFTTRTTWNPWFEMDGTYALHWGVSYSIRNPPALNAAGQPVTTGGIRRTLFKTRPEIRVNAPDFADTGVIDSDLLNLVGLEAALGSGPLLVQSEYVAALVSPSAAAPVAGSYFHGFYVQSSLLLTGEHRPYLRRSGIFGPVQPHENFFRHARCGGGRITGTGAWEAGLRFSWLDLNDGTVEGGELVDVTAGLNWYLNPSSRLMFNYIAMHRDAPNPHASGWASIIASRFQIDF